MIAQDISWLGENWARVLVAIFSGGTFAIVVRFYTVWRRGRSDDFRTEVDGDDKLRDHYAQELQSLRDQITRSGEAHAERARQTEERHRLAMEAADSRFNRAMEAADVREAACQAEVRALRVDVLRLSDEVIGLRRQLGQAARSALVIATHAPSETLLASAERAADALDKLDQERHQ